MSDAVNSWNTRMPDTSGIAETARNLGAMGFDVHTVHIVLNGRSGAFDVEMLATDHDMDDHCFELEFGRYGSLERI